MGIIKIVNNTDGTNYWCNIEKCNEISLIEERDWVEIILVDHSTNCKYTEKALNVQIKGGKIMLLAYDSNNINDEYNVDDLIGEKINIPTMIIGKDFGDLIKEFYKENPNDSILISIKFSGVKKDNKVKFDLFYRSDDLKSLNFFSEFKSYKKRLDKQLIFTPRLKYSNFVNELSSNELKSDSKYPCIKDFHFCTTANNYIGIDNPREILLENLRQSCIFETFGLDSFWEYMIKFNDNCADIQNINFNENCSNYVIQSLKFDEKSLNQCLNNLIYGKGKIEDDFNYFMKKKIYTVPEIILNGVKYKGSFSARQIYNTICNSFINDEEGKCKIDINQIKERKNIGFRIILTISLIIFFLLICTLLCYRRMVSKYLEKTINEKIQEQAIKAIGQYKAFKEGKIEGEKLEIVNE